MVQKRDAKYFDELIFNKAGRSFHTQNSPILPEVFVKYGISNHNKLDLLLTPDWSKPPADLATLLIDSFDIEDIDEDTNDEILTRSEEFRERTNIVFNQSVVASKLTFEELICHVVPLSWWWRSWLIKAPNLDPVSACIDLKRKEVVRKELKQAIEIELGERKTSKSDMKYWIIRQELGWAARLFWLVQGSNREGKKNNSEDDVNGIVNYLLDDLIPKIASSSKGIQSPLKYKSGYWVYSVDQNRKVSSATRDSLKTTKVDAAVKTFDVRGEGISWAVIDTGIDAKHLAFRKLDENGSPERKAFDGNRNNTRIKATYDFTNIRYDLSREQLRGLKSDNGRLMDWESIENRLTTRFRIPQVENPTSSLSTGYKTPVDSHGTHVAGILAANWIPNPDQADPIGPSSNSTADQVSLIGLCPEIELYDLRVFDEDGTGDEFAVMSALQFVRSINQRHDVLEIHGVNLSLSMEHDVKNYACGRSPVCMECSRLVGNGVVVVAAAGNDGRNIYRTTQGYNEEGYRVASIKDPGNTEDVITVGSTHRREPHNYGISYFSSRGPTGDGRLKPDLVAPGEKITSTAPGDRLECQDGTSQAAPHVSGAAALLMCRHREIIGQPKVVKKTLMDSATDLGREKYFQGAGLVDVMRAIQSR